ncbi:MAG: hypothetical protein V3V62_08670, partial [bacterium]
MKTLSIPLALLTALTVAALAGCTGGHIPAASAGRGYRSGDVGGVAATGRRPEPGRWPVRNRHSRRAETQIERDLAEALAILDKIHADNGKLGLPAENVVLVTPGRAANGASRANGSQTSDGARKASNGSPEGARKAVALAPSPGLVKLREEGRPETASAPPRADLPSYDAAADSAPPPREEGEERKFMATGR